jgi:Glycosyl hydrolases family 18
VDGVTGALATLLALAMGGPGHRVPVLCYVETVYGGARPDALDLSACTHVIEAFLLPDAAGGLRPANGLPRHELIRAARRQGSRVLVAVGGATVPGATFAALAASATTRARLVETLVRLVLDAGYDGVDLDWEFPAATEQALQVELVSALRRGLDAAFATRRPGARPELVVGVTPGARLEGYDFPALAPLVDWFVQFGYDLRNPALGPWANTAPFWPDGATRPIEGSVRGVATELLRRGVPREKLVVALPLYAADGRPWVDVRERALAAPAAFDPLYLERRWDGTWITDPPALEAKVRRIVAGTEIAGGPAAGIALWQLGHQGAFRELTGAVRRGLAACVPRELGRPLPAWPRHSRRVVR